MTTSRTPDKDFFIAVVIITIAVVKQFRLDAYVMDTLMPDLVLHDRRPSAFLVYLHLSYRFGGTPGALRASHQDIVDATGLSKSAGRARYVRYPRRLLRGADGAPPVPEYTCWRPWRK